MRNTRRIAALSLGFAFAIGGSLASAQCDNCQNGSMAYGTQSAGSGFGAMTGSGRYAQNRENYRIWHDDYRQKADVISQRNFAWPKPFACQDRDTYFQLMSITYDAGWLSQCTLTDVHFDQSTGQLNLAGQNKVQSIIANNPLDKRNVYILHNTNVLETQERLETVQSAVGKWYGADLAKNVVVTDRLPQEVSGQRIERINNMYGAGTPVPMIEVGSSTASSSSSSGTGTSQ